MRIRLISCGLAIALLGLLAGPAHGQYEELSIHPGYTLNANRIYLHNTWDPGFGPELSINTPFHLGYIEAAAAYHRYNSREAEAPDFNALQLQLGWGIRYEPVDPIRLDGGLRIGNYSMEFLVEDGRERAELIENELNMALQARATAKLYGPLAAYLSASYQRTFSRIRLDLVYLSFGLSYRFSTPEWLRTFLR